ncbi:PD40 domain-containing protein [candidate division KSB1 bacterium]|nr:PD40 domain-containing protein [candidate division KSB1 bacterium]
MTNTRRKMLAAAIMFIMTTTPLAVKGDTMPDFQGDARVGKRYPSEKASYIDEKTGVTVTMLTTTYARDNKLYQTHPSWTADGACIIFSSDRSGSEQLYALHEASGEIVQLTHDSKVSPEHSFVNRYKNTLYYVCGDRILELDINKALGADGQLLDSKAGFQRPLATLPPHLKLSGTLTVDADGEWVIIGTERQDKKSQWAIYKINLGSGEFVLVTELDFHVGHCQSHPTRPGLIMFCHETGGDADQRMWLVDSDGSNLRPFYKETFNEWVTHEVWWGADRALFTIWPYNEEMRKKPHGIAAVELESGEMTILSQHAYWHVGGSPDGKWAVGDTFEGDLYLVRADTRQTKLLTGGHRPPGATVHPHPSFSPDGKRVLFCSEKNGHWDLFLIELPNWEKLP